MQVEKDVRASSRVLARDWKHISEEDKALSEQKKMSGQHRKGLPMIALGGKIETKAIRRPRDKAGADRGKTESSRRILKGRPRQSTLSSRNKVCGSLSTQRIQGRTLLSILWDHRVGLEGFNQEKSSDDWRGASGRVPHQKEKFRWWGLVRKSFDAERRN